MRRWLVPCLLAAAMAVSGCAGTFGRTPGFTLPPVGDPPAVAVRAAAATAVKGVPRPAEVSRAFLTGPARKAPGRPLTDADLAKVLTWLQSAQIADGEISPLPRGGATMAVFELRSGGSVSVHIAHDCETTPVAGGTQKSCQAAEGQVIFGASQGPMRLRAPDLARWLADAATVPMPADVPALDEITRARVSLGKATPPDRTPLPLFPATARDRAVIEKLLGWLAAARVIGGEIHAPGRSPSLVLERQGGGVRSLRSAYDCVVTQTPDSRREQCQRAEGQVIFSGGTGQEPHRLHAPELAAWLVQGWEQDVLRGTPPTGLIVPAANKPDGIPAMGDVTQARLVGFDLSQPPAPLPAGDARGQAVISKVLDWLDHAAVLETLTADQVARGEVFDVPRGRSTVLYLDLQSGTRAAVRRAYDCASTPKDGGESTTCQPRTGEVMFFPAGDKGALRLQAPELAQWLQDGWQQDLPALATAAPAAATAKAEVKTKPTPLAKGPATDSKAALGVDDVVAILVARGLTAVRTGQDIPPLFGAQSAEVVSVGGYAIQVYVCADEPSAASAFKVASDPQRNTVSWATDPHFVQRRNLLITVGTSDASAAARIAAVLSPVAPPPHDTAASATADLQRTGLQAVLAQPTAPAAVSSDQAQIAAARVLGAMAAGTTVTAEYTLLTLPGTPGITARPVYLVTYDGVPLLPTGQGPVPAGQGGGATTPATRGPVRGKVTAVIDATTGNWIMGIAR